MQFANLSTPARAAKIALEPSNWGAPYQKLFDQTDASGFELFVLDQHENYNDPFHKAREQIYNQRGGYALIVRDIVRDGGRGTDDKGRLHVQYVSHAGTQWEKKHSVWMPKEGWYAPTEDGMFHEGTLAPFETLRNKDEAIKRLEARSVPKDMISYFYRLGSYKNDERFVGVGFFPDWRGIGRFYVDADWLPSGSGRGGVASLPRYEDAQTVMESSWQKPAKK